MEGGSGRPFVSRSNIVHYFGIAAISFEAAGWASSAMLLIAMKFLLLTCTVI